MIKHHSAIKNNGIIDLHSMMKIYCVKKYHVIKASLFLKTVPNSLTGKMASNFPRFPEPAVSG